MPVLDDSPTPSRSICTDPCWLSAHHPFSLFLHSGEISLQELLHHLQAALPVLVVLDAGLTRCMSCSSSARRCSEYVRSVSSVGMVSSCNVLFTSEHLNCRSGYWARIFLLSLLMSFMRIIASGRFKPMSVARLSQRIQRRKPVQASPGDPASVGSSSCRSMMVRSCHEFAHQSQR